MVSTWVRSALRVSSEAVKWPRHFGGWGHPASTARRRGLNASHGRDILEGRRPEDARRGYEVPWDYYSLKWGKFKLAGGTRNGYSHSSFKDGPSQSLARFP